MEVALLAAALAEYAAVINYCCGAGMLLTMYDQVSLMYTGLCDQSNPPGAGCNELWTSFETEMVVCCSCGYLMDG